MITETIPKRQILPNLFTSDKQITQTLHLSQDSTL